MSTVVSEDQLKELAEDVLTRYPEQQKVYATKDGCIFLSENHNAALLHAGDIGKREEVYTFENANFKIAIALTEGEENFDFTDPNDPLRALIVIPTKDWKNDDIKAWLTEKGIEIPNAVNKAQLLELVASVPPAEPEKEEEKVDEVNNTTLPATGSIAYVEPNNTPEV